jgi:predicted permease
MKRTRWIERLHQDVKYGCRSLRQSPVFTLVTILTLAIGIGAATTVAAQINAVFFAPPAVRDVSTVRSLSWSSPRRAFAEGLFRGPTWDARTIQTVPHAVFQQVDAHVSAFAATACWRNATEAITEAGLVRVQAVSGSYFRTLGIAAVAGRTITGEDDDAGAPLVAVARDPALVDRTVRIHGHLFTIVGAVRADFAGLAPLAPANFFVPYAADHLFPTFQRNSWSECQVVARIKPNVPVELAAAETEVLVRQIVAANPPKEAYEPPRVHLEDLSASRAEMKRAVETPLRLVAGTVGLLLLITCANIGGLLFARGRARRKEIATRLALGGGQIRIVQQLLTESFLLCAAGAALGLLVAAALNPLLPRMLGELTGPTAIGVALRPDGRVLLFVLAVSVTCGMLFGLLPALTLSRSDPASVLKQASGIAPPTRLRTGKAALAVQLALSMIVLGGATLLVRTMVNLRAVPLGYTPERLVFVETNNPVGRPRAFVEETLAALQTLPGVTTATVSQWPIFNNTVLRAGFCIPGATPPQQQLDLSFVFPRFFDTWGVRLLSGRDIDDSGQPGAIVNETFVKRFLDGKDPLTQVIGAGGDCPGRTQHPIIGVVADHVDRQRVELVPAVYLRYPRAGALYVTTYAVRTDGDPAALVPAVRRVIGARSLAPTRDVMTGLDYRDGITSREHLLMSLLVFFAGVSLFISCLGVYGMLSYSVGWRTAEIGLRLAVGAPPRSVLWLIVRESLGPLATGLVLGAAGAMLLGPLLESVLFKISAHDPTALSASAAILLAAGVIAALLPARRACRIDPVPALRCE